MTRWHSSVSMKDSARQAVYEHGFNLILLSLTSLIYFGAADSSVARAKAIGASLSVQASVTTSARDIYSEVSRDEEDVLAELRYSLLISQILDSNEESDIARGVQKVKRVFTDLQIWLHPDTEPKDWFSGQDEALSPEDEQSWLDGNGTDFATSLISCGACASLLAGLAASGIAQQFGIPHNDALAVHALQLAQEAGDESADIAMADRLLEGRGVPQDCQAGMMLALASAEEIIRQEEQSGQAGMPPMEPPLLRLRWRDAAYAWSSSQQHAHYEETAAGGMPGADADAAVQELQAMVDEDVPYGFLALGHHLVHGQHVQANHDNARMMFQAAADLGEPGGLVGLGYLEMQSDVPNVAAARRAYEAAAAMGNAEGLFNLGAIYGGTFAGVPKEHVNLTKSEEHFMKAFYAGHYKAPLMLAHIYNSGSGVEANCSKAAGYVRVVLHERRGWSDDIAEAVRSLDEGKHGRALVMQASVVEEGSLVGMLDLAFMLQHSLGYNASGRHWRALVMQASVAEEGSPIGMLNLAFMLQHSLGYNASDRHALAYDLLLRAARLERYYGDGLVDAAALVYDGDRLGIPGGRNLSRALELYEQAAGRNDTEGITGLAWMHEHGEGVGSEHANATLALQLYWQAVEGASDAGYAAAPFVLYWWLRIKVLAAHIPRLEYNNDRMTDLFSLVTFTLSLVLVVWLRRTRNWPGFRQQR